MAQQNDLQLHTLIIKDIYSEFCRKWQNHVKDGLISDQEIETIKLIWATDLIAMHSQGEK